MWEIITASLSVISNVKTIFDVVRAVSNYVKKESKELNKNSSPKGFLAYGDENLALEKTFEEWKHIAFLIEPKIKKEFLSRNPSSLPEKAELLANLSEKYKNLADNKQLSLAENEELFHTAVAFPSDNEVNIYLGRSSETDFLQGEEIYINGNNNSINYLNRRNMTLPTFKVTMLGGTEAGKSVFMASMYCKLRDGNYGVRIRGVNRGQDIELDAIMSDIYYSKVNPIV